ncbi:MAG TPA: O-antigen ligase family protein [Gemmatimonadales bacterium]|nr:O-antigen ligase family protein [Gemmatimonadales bacterium]
MSRAPVQDEPLRTSLVLQGGLLLLVASIPFEYPERTIPLEIPTLTGAVFLLVTLFHPKRCYGRLPAPAFWFGAYLVALLLAILLGQRERASAALSDYVVLLQGILVFLAAGNLMRDERVARRALMTLVAACSVRAALPFLGYSRTTSAVWTGGERISALGQNANSAAMILAAGLVTLIGLTLMRRRKRVPGLMLAGGLGVLLGLAILETGSRGGLASLLGGVVVLALAADSWRHRLRNGAIALVAVSSLTFAALQLPVMKNRLRDAATTGNLAGREQLYPALWTMFLEKPVLGWGPVTNNYELALRVGTRDRGSRATHNLILELLTAGGLVTAIPFFVGAWLSVRGAWQARSGEHGVLPLALCCSLFLANMSGEWGASKLLWLVLAYAFVSGKWHVALLRSVPIRSRRWVMALPSGARS